MMLFYLCIKRTIQAINRSKIIIVFKTLTLNANNEKLHLVKLSYSYSMIIIKIIEFEIK